MTELVRNGVGALLLMGLGTTGALVDALELSAQGEGTALLRGIVFDSTSMKALPGARVAVIGTNATGLTDPNGSFLLEDVPAGSYWVSFYHERLQQLGVSPPSRQVNLVGGQILDVPLAVPSEETLLLGWCLAEQPTSGFGAIAGVVTDELTGVAMPRAIVTAEPASRSTGIQPIEVRTDDSGIGSCLARGGESISLIDYFMFHSC